MKIFAVSFGLLMGFAFANAFQNYANYGNVNRTHPGYKGTNQWGNEYQGVGNMQYNPNSANYQQQQAALSYHPSQYPVGQQHMPLSYPAPSYPSNYQGNYNNMGQQQQQAKDGRTQGHGSLRHGWTNPYYANQHAGGQQHMNLNYDPYANQKPIKDEWIVPVKVSLTYGPNKQAAQFQPIKTSYNQQAPVKTTYYTKK